MCRAQITHRASIRHRSPNRPSRETRAASPPSLVHSRVFSPRCPQTACLLPAVFIRVCLPQHARSCHHSHVVCLLSAALYTRKKGAAGPLFFFASPSPEKLTLPLHVTQSYPGLFVPRTPFSSLHPSFCYSQTIIHEQSKSLLLRIQRY